MGRFDFITDEDFRKSLEIDFQEMSQCFNAKAWKAAHVLAGSIVEAVLIDYIIVEGHTSRDQALKMDLGNAINFCKDRKIISARTAELSSVIKGYRNLIHPGRLIRLNEDVNQDSAEVAKALVNMVVSEIEELRRDKHGYTAEQIVAKIRRDSSVDVIVSHLVKGTNPIEVERLLLKVLHDSYMQYLEEPEVIEHVPSSFTLCFRTVFDQASDELKKRTAARFVKIIKEEGDMMISGYGQLFFRASDLRYLDGDDTDLVKKYLFGRLKNDPGNWLTTLSGIGQFISADEVLKFVDPLVSTISNREADLSKEAQKRLEEEWWVMSSNIKHLAMKRLGEWIPFYREKERESHAIRIEQVKANLEASNLPFS